MLDDLLPIEDRPQTLFDTPRETSAALMSALGQVNGRFGKKTLVIASKVAEIVTGAVTLHVRVDVGGTIVTSATTNEVVKDLKLAVGDQAYAVIKATDVTIGKDV